MCNKEFEPAHNNQKYCSVKCRNKATAISEAKKRGTLPRKPWHYCKRKDCLYYHDTKNFDNRCDYLWLTGQPRGCGRGAECTKYKHSTPKKREEYRNSILKEDGVKNKPIYARFL